MSDDVRTCTCYKKIKSVAVIMSRKMYMCCLRWKLSRMQENLLDVVRSESVVNVEVASDDKFRR